MNKVQTGKHLGFCERYRVFGIKTREDGNTERIPIADVGHRGHAILCMDNATEYDEFEMEAVFTDIYTYKRTGKPENKQI